jgi:hypothetical protein
VSNSASVHFRGSAGYDLSGSGCQITASTSEPQFTLWDQQDTLQADQQVVDRAARAATGGQGGKTTGSAPTSGQNKASNSPAAAGQTKKFYQSGVDAARKVESVQGRQYVLWAKGVRGLRRGKK